MVFKLDNITRGTWKLYIFEEDLFKPVCKLDNIIRGTWKPHFVDEA